MSFLHALTLSHTRSDTDPNSGTDGSEIISRQNKSELTLEISEWILKIS